MHAHRAIFLHDEMEVTCPRTFECDPPRTSFDIGPAPSYVSIVSSSLSCLGSILIVIAYIAFKDMRTGAQKVITLLAIADFFTAFGYIIGAANFLAHFNVKDERRCEAFEALCEIQSFITTWSTMCSYLWTCILAFYFFMVIVYNKAQLAAKLIPLYNVIAWLSPLTIMLPLLGCGKLGYAPYVASNWCYIKDTDYASSLKEKGEIIGFILIGGKLWEIFTYIFILTLYIIIRAHISKGQRQINDPHLIPKVVQVEKRLLAIPLLYLFLRMWGTLQFFYSLAVAGTNDRGCIPQAVHIAFFIFGIFQAIGDGGQGWCNVLLYIFLSPIMRRRLFIKPIGKVIIVVGDKLADLLETDLETNSRVSKHINATSDLPSESSTLVTAAGYQIKKYASTTTEATIFSAAGTTPGTAPQNLQSSTRSVNKSSEV